jgi:hypothetical protein
MLAFSGSRTRVSHQYESKEGARDRCCDSPIFITAKTVKAKQNREKVSLRTGPTRLNSCNVPDADEPDWALNNPNGGASSTVITVIPEGRVVGVIFD